MVTTRKRWLFVTKMAMEFRAEFKKDVVIDIICYRKLGHNEQDEPMVTQPLMYKKIAAHPGTRKLYADKPDLGRHHRRSRPRAHGQGDYRAALDEGRLASNPVLTNHQRRFAVDWTPLPEAALYRRLRHPRAARVNWRCLGERLTTLPEGFSLHSRVQKIIDDRRGMAAGTTAGRLGHG
jgi:2-oxoglutarate dehydrogenase E1 component